ncbi:MAG: hypothetical protein IK020_10135 [Clostridiales bacterium]|nr:hypothetical protein [Clostridiales bacterium]
MQSDTQEKRIMWYAAVLALLGQCVALAVSGRIPHAVVLFVLNITFLNLTFFSENKRTVFPYLILATEVAAVVLGARWYIGVLALPVITLPFFTNRKILRLIGVLLLVGGLSLHIYYSRPDAVTLLIRAGATVLFYVAWEGLLALLAHTAETNEKLNLALTAAAVDAMEQRTLREEIARNQKVNENNARLEERERISRDIHNYVGHTLSAASVTLDAATVLVPNDQAKALEKIDVANSRVHEAISNVRSVVRTLDAEDDRIALDDYLLSLEKHIEEFKMDTSIKVYHNFSQIKSKTRIPIQTASFLSSSLSELLTNGLKHGHANLFVITFVLDGTHIRLKVQDNGFGWGKISLNEKKLRLANGFGLRKIRDYTESCGGSFEIESEEGFTVSLSLPFEEEHSGKEARE